MRVEVCAEQHNGIKIIKNTVLYSNDIYAYMNWYQVENIYIM